MIPYAAGDTWGITGSTFLAGYAALIFLGAVGALALLFLLTPLGQDPERPPHPYLLAYISGGAAAALMAAIAALRTGGVIATPRSKTLRRLAPTPVDAHPLDAVIMRTIGDQGRRVSTLFRDRRVRSALRALGDEARELHLLADGRRRVMLTIVSFLPTLIVVVGFVRLVAGLSADKPVGGLVVEILVAALVAYVVRKFGRGRRRTYAGTRLLRELRKTNRHLSRRSSPSYAAYGPSAAALSVGLFGAGVLVTADPALAHAVDSSLLKAGSGSTFGGGGGGGCSGGGGGCGGGGGGGGGGCGG